MGRAAARRGCGQPCGSLSRVSPNHCGLAVCPLPPACRVLACVCLQWELHLQGTHVLVTVGQGAPCWSWVKSGRAQLWGDPPRGRWSSLHIHHSTSHPVPVTLPAYCCPQPREAQGTGRWPRGPVLGTYHGSLALPPGRRGGGQAVRLRPDLALAQGWPWHRSPGLGCPVGAQRLSGWQVEGAGLGADGLCAAAESCFQTTLLPRGGKFGVSAVNDVSPGSPGRSAAGSEMEGTWSAAHCHPGSPPTPAAHHG